MNRNILGYDKKALKKLLLYSWPGNVRELQNIIEGTVVIAKSDHISADDLKVMVQPMSFSQKRPGRKQIIDVLKLSSGKISTAAKFLGVTRQTFYNYVKKYHVEHKAPK